MIRQLCFTAALVALCAPVQAALVSASFTETAPGTWELTASAIPEAGDTQGIAAYAFRVDGLVDLGINPVDMVWVEAPLSVLNATFAPVGFATASAGPVGADRFSVGNTQANATNKIFGIGAQDVHVAQNPNVPTPDVNTGVPALLGTLTVPGAVALNASNFFVGLSLFPNPLTGQTIAVDNVQLTVTPFGGGGTGPDLGSGGALDFGYNGQSQIITLTNTGDETANFLGDQFEITGDDAGLFSLVNPNFNPIGAGENRQFEVLFNSGSNAQASYSAALTFLTDAGVDPSFTLTAQVPEPSTVALAGLGMVGLVGLARRRRK